MVYTAVEHFLSTIQYASGFIHTNTQRVVRTLYVYRFLFCAVERRDVCARERLPNTNIFRISR